MNTEPKVLRKKCSECQDWKRVDTEYHKEKSKPLGVQAYCKFCKQKVGKKYRAELKLYPGDAPATNSKPGNNAGTQEETTDGQ